MVCHPMVSLELLDRSSISHGEPDPLNFEGTGASLEEKEELKGSLSKRIYHRFFTRLSPSVGLGFAKIHIRELELLDECIDW